MQPHLAKVSMVKNHFLYERPVSDQFGFNSTKQILFYSDVHLMYIFPFSAQPVHWNYKLDKLDAIFGDKTEIEFITPSANPFYEIETGRQSCYGDQAFVLLQSLVASKGRTHKNEQFLF